MEWMESWVDGIMGSISGTERFIVFDPAAPHIPMFHFFTIPTVSEANQFEAR